MEQQKKTAEAEAEAISGVAEAPTGKNVQPTAQQPTQITPEEAAERAERIQKLVTGRITAPNEIVGYMVQQLRKVMQESDVLSKELQQAESRAAQARNRLIELRGMRVKYIDDIEAFDKPPAKPQPPTESAEGEKAEVAA